MNPRSARTNVAVAVLCALLWSGFAPPAGADDGRAAPPYDATVLSEIAGEVMRKALTRPAPSTPVAVSPDAKAVPQVGGDGTELAPDSPLTHIAPARAGITVPVPPGAAAAAKAKPEVTSTGYRSNSPRRGHGKAPAPGASGLDPALEAHAASVRATGRPFVYGFVKLRVPVDTAVEKGLAGSGITLLGPHDDLHKARLPIGALAAIASLPEVAWLGASPPARKLSAELAAQLGPEGRTRGIGAATALPIVVSLFEHDATGAFRRELEATGATVGEYDPELSSYRAVATPATIDSIAALDFVLFVELIGVMSPGHDMSMPLVDADVLRPGSTPLGHTRFGAATVTVGVMDTGFEMGAGGHADLNKFGCGLDLTTDNSNPFDDLDGHGTHVLGTIVGTGTANPRFRGVATAVGSLDRIRVAKVFTKTGGQDAWIENAMDFMSQASACGSPPPEVINFSGGAAGFAHSGTDSTSRKLDQKVWTYGQAYVVCSGNNGPGDSSIWRPGVAKNALTVGNVFDWGYRQVGDLNDGSSRGPTGDGRMKPNLVAPGAFVHSAKAGTTHEYREASGCSMATPHVSGLAATLMDHYPDFRGRPALLRAHMMATAIAHEDAVGKSNLYGLGRASGYLAHWDHPNSAGWQTYKFWGGVSSQGFQYSDIVVPPGTKRLVVVLTWDEPAASAGASRAVTYDLDLWLDHNADCGFIGACGEYGSGSFVDNVEYVVVQNPPAGTYRMKVQPWSAPTFSLPYGMVAHIVRGDPTPAMAATLTAPSTAQVGSLFDVKVSVSTPSYVVSAAQAALPDHPAGVTFLGFETTRHDGSSTGFLDPDADYTLGNIVPLLGRSAVWSFRADTQGPKTFAVRVWSENGGEVTVSKTVQVVAPLANLLESAVTPNPPSPVRAPGTTFSVTDTVHNLGAAASRSSTTRYYLSRDAVKDAGDRLLTGSRPVPVLAVGASHTGTATVTIPSATPFDTYHVLACADALNAVVESDETNNCSASAATVTVTRPDLVVNALSAPPASAARGSLFPVTETVHNSGMLASALSRTRYYLSLDGVRSVGDRLLAAIRTVPALAAGASNAGTVTVTIPSTTPLGTYFVLACADATNLVLETNETNNCRSSGTTVTITP